MNVEIFKKADGSMQTVTNNVVTLDGPSIVRVRLGRSEVTSMLRDGNDLVVTLTNGETVRLVNFYGVAGQPDASVNDLVLQEANGSVWQATPSATSPFKALKSWDEFLSSSLAVADSGGGGGFILPVLGLAGAAGIAAAAGGGGGGGGGNPPPPATPDTTPPIAPTARLVVDSGRSTTDLVSNDGRIQATGVETGATLQYQINGGTWTSATGTGFELQEGSHTNVKVRQVDAAGNVGPTSDVGNVVIDKTPPPAVTGTRLTVDSGPGPNDNVSNDGRVQTNALEAGATLQYQIDGGAWVDATGPGFVLGEGTHRNVRVRQVDLAGNASVPATLGDVVIDKTNPPALTDVVLSDDTGASGTDKVSSDGRILVRDLEPNATLQYKIDGGDWVTASTNPFLLPVGEYDSIRVRQIDLAGNIGQETNIGAVTIDQTGPDPLDSAALVLDSGSSQSDNVTNDGRVKVVGLDPEATLQYQFNGIDWIDATGDTFELVEGDYSNLKVRQIDLAGNPSDSIDVTHIIVDKTAPPAVVANFNISSGPTGSTTNDNKIILDRIEDNATVFVYLNGSTVGTLVTGSEFTLVDGTYTNISFEQIDLAGNSSGIVPVLLTPITVNTDTPPAIVVNLNDTGVSAIDKITRDDDVEVVTKLPNHTYQYSVDGGVSWRSLTSTAKGFLLEEGTHPDLLVRQINAAFTPSPATSMGTVVIDKTPPGAIQGTMVDTIPLGDLITTDPNMRIEGLETGARVQYRSANADPDAGWNYVAVVTDPSTGISHVVLPDGNYTNIEVRQVDQAGNIGARSPINLVGPIEIDTDPPGAVTISLQEDTAPDLPSPLDEPYRIDRVTSNNLFTVTGKEPGTVLQYSIDNGVTWRLPLTATDTTISLADGHYPNLLIRQVDAAGNPSQATPSGTFTIDMSDPATLAGTWEDSDPTTENGRLNITGAEPDAFIQYTTDGGTTWTTITLTAGGYTFPPGTYTALQLRQIDLAGNDSPPSVPLTKVIEVPTTFTAFDDDVSLVLLDEVASSSNAQSSNAQFLQIPAASFVGTPAQSVVIEGTKPGMISVVVQQTALAAVANGFAVLLLDSNGVEVARAATAGTPIAGNVASLSLLGALGDDGLTAQFNNLAPGTYTVRVIKDQSSVEQFIRDSSLSELGQDGVVIGADNRTLILQALGRALDTDVSILPEIRTAVIGAAANALDVGNGTPLPRFVASLSSILTASGVTGSATTLVNTFTRELLSNFVSLFETTDIETTTISYAHPVSEYRGNVFEDNGKGADLIVDPASPLSLTSIIYKGDTYNLAGNTSILITTDFGTLEINSNGAFTFTTDATKNSIGQTETFTYDATDGTGSDTATLSIRISDTAVPSVPIEAINDNIALNMGLVTAQTLSPIVASNVEIVKLPTSVNPNSLDSRTAITVGADKSGAVKIEVQQQSILAIADAFRVDLFDSSGKLVGTAATSSSPFSGIAGVTVLGRFDNDTLVAKFDGLKEGTYYAVVSNDDSTLNSIIGRLELSDLGSSFVVDALNQQVILNAITNTLSLSPETQLLLAPVLAAANPLLANSLGQPITSVLDSLRGPLSPLLNALIPIDRLIDNISNALLRDLVELWETTEVTATVTEFDFASELISGNVITGVGGGTADIGSSIAKVRVITNENGESKVVLSGSATEIAGKYGDLVIQVDGSFTYTSHGNPASIGKTESFTYALNGAPGAPNLSAQLNIAITGDPQTLSSDVGTADITWRNVVQEGAVSGTYNQSTLLGILGVTPPTVQTGFAFTVSDTQKYTGTVQVLGTLSVLQGGTLVLERLQGGNWVTVNGTSRSLAQLAQVGQTSVTLDIGALGLSNGSYRVKTTLTGVLSNISVVADIDRILTTEFAFSGATQATGNIFDNDVLGSFSSTLAVKADHVGAYSDVSGTRSIVGDFGTLAINSDGSYTYTVRSDVNYSAVPRADIFDYRVTHPSGNVEISQLRINITPDGGTMSGASFRSSSMSDLLDNFLGTEEQNSNADHAQNGHTPDNFEYLAPLPLDDQHIPAHI